MLSLTRPLPSNLKEKQRASRFAKLNPAYQAPFLEAERSILAKPIRELVQDVQGRVLSPGDVLRTYGKVAVKAHESTNCVTELMLLEAEQWTEKEFNFKGPLAGVPISLKDTIRVKGFDASVGYSRYTGEACMEDGIQVKLLRNAGMASILLKSVTC